MKRELEVILFALDWYSRTRGGSAGALETNDVAVKLRKDILLLIEADDLNKLSRKYDR